MHIHYNGPAVPTPVYAGDWDAVRSFLRGVQRFHMGPQRGWSDIGYSFFIDRVGRIWEGRGWGVAGAHTQGFNSTSHAIYFIIGDGQEPSPAQVEAGRQLIAEHNRRYGVGYVRGHQQAPGNSTSCPGGPLMDLIYAGTFKVGTAPAPSQTPADPNVDWAGVRRWAAGALLPQVQALPTLRRGSRGPAVKTLQEALNVATAPTPALATDGDFGPGTEAVVRRFQAFFKLGADGIVGPKTRGMLAFCLARIKDGQQ